MEYLQIFAGHTARKMIEQHGFSQQLFSAVLGASGGPKWFTLYGLDRYLMGEFFHGRSQPLNLIGSSAGSYRFAALAQNDPVAAIERLATFYSQVTYSEKPSLDEIGRKAYEVLDFVLGEQGAAQILANPIVRAHFIVAKTIGLVSSEHQGKQLSGLIYSYLLNRVNRKHLAKQYQRVIFSHHQSDLQLIDPYGISTEQVPLTADNLRSVLYASGAIPLVMHGVQDINGAGVGTYRDGGIIDYHFDFKIVTNQQSLVLYPHFSQSPKAGWFDKSLRRPPLASSYDNVVMLAPTQAFIERLPYQKIPDRNDFKRLSDSQRIAYWQEVLKLSYLLAEDFTQFVAQPSPHLIHPFYKLGAG